MFLFCCQKCSLCEGFPSWGVVMGSFGVCVWFFFYTMTPSTTKPLMGGIILLSLSLSLSLSLALSLSLTLSFACLLTVLSVSVSWSLDLVSLCNWVFCLCLVFESDTADACGSVRRGQEGLNGGLVAGWSSSAFGAEDSQSSPPALIFLFPSRTHHSYQFTCSSPPFPGVSIKRSPTLLLTLTLSLSVSRWVQGLVSRSLQNPAF